MNWRHPNLPSSLRHHWDDGHLEEATDLILMDIQMPVLDAYDATRHIKVDPNLESTPEIAVSSFAIKGDEQGSRGLPDSIVTSRSPIAPLRSCGSSANSLSEQG
jgi:CheY-like chemotaxis protein